MKSLPNEPVFNNLLDTEALLRVSSIMYHSTRHFQSLFFHLPFTSLRAPAQLLLGFSVFIELEVSPHTCIHTHTAQNLLMRVFVCICAWLSKITHGVSLGVCIPVQVCLYVNTHCICIFQSVYGKVSAFTLCLDVHRWVCLYLHICACLYVGTCMPVYECMLMCVCVRASLSIHIHICLPVHVSIHTSNHSIRVSFSITSLRVLFQNKGTVLVAGEQLKRIEDLYKTIHLALTKGNYQFFK